ncbi:hypothetical protein [Aliikangiella sp. G2MR2-5]|uniref:DUF6942 family protein n=1 Tax=Aliikangiella sp. G2MR2-5 TaxID=2788943 RepID=UPI0018ABC571|nr:hypothetical protein [Aliikangiella sp. G2MR2-5]
MAPQLIGLGNSHANIVVCIGNRPPLDEYQQLDSLRPMRNGEIKSIADRTGNHWRKIFNCFAKFAFDLEPENFACWQDLRDESLLQKDSNYALLFSQPDWNTDSQIRVICGKQYFFDSIGGNIEWVDEFFAVDKKRKLIVSPYFDYRQLSNVKIEALKRLITGVNC